MAFARRQWNLLLQRIRYAHLSDSVFRHLQRMRKCKEKHKDVYTCDTRKHRSIKFWRDRTTTFWCEIWLCNMAYLCLRRLVGTYDATTQAQAHESENRSILLCLYLRLRRRCKLRRRKHKHWHKHTVQGAYACVARVKQPWKDGASKNKYVAKADLRKGYWNKKKNLGVTTHFTGIKSFS